MTSCRFEFFLSYILKVDFTHLWWTQAIWCCDHRLSGQESIYGPAKLKLYFKKILRHSGEMEFNIYQFHMEIKCILKLTSPNQIKRKCNNYSTQYIVRFLKKKNVEWPLLNHLKCWSQNPGLPCGLRKINVNPPETTGSLHVASRLNLWSEPHAGTSNYCLRLNISSHFVLAAFHTGTGGFRAFSCITNQTLFHGFHF